MTIYDENQIIVLDIATDEDYLRYINREKVSDMQAAFLVSAYVPYPDFKLSYNSSRLQRDIYEVYLFLKNGAEVSSHPGIIKKGDTYFANLQTWTGYLHTKDHPVAEPLNQAFLKHEQHILSEGDELTAGKQSFQLNNITAILQAKLEILDHIFPDAPYKYYMLFPTVKEIISKLNITEKRFGDIASNALKRPRRQGRPSKNIIKKYRIKHPDLHAWFDEIERKYWNKDLSKQAK